jgi:ferric-dicitrate binding protein FerR (iron transport regulator)
MMPMLALAAGRVSAEENGSRIGVVSRATGQAFAQLSNTRPLTAAAEILLGDLVWTDVKARLGLDLDGGTRIFLGEKARLKIDRFVAEDGGTLVLGEGAMVFDRPDDLPKTNISVQTAFGLIGVRGTQFFAGPSRGVFGVFCARGAVTVSAGGAERRLGVGEGVDIAAPGAAAGDVRKWGDARIKEALASVLT